MELQWLRRERQRGRGAITRLSLWRHLLVVVSRHRLVCVNRTTELSGWAWSFTFPSAPASNKEEDNDDWWRRTRILLKNLKRRQSWTNILHWSSNFSQISDDGRLIINSVSWHWHLKIHGTELQDFFKKSFLKTVQNTDLSNFDGSLWVV